MKRQARYSMKKGQLVDNYAPVKQAVVRGKVKIVPIKKKEKPNYTGNVIIVAIVVLALAGILALRTNLFGFYN